MVRRPTTQSIKRVFKWLEETGLRVYGPNADLDKRVLYPSCMDYSAEDAIRFYKLKDKLQEDNE